MGGGNHAAGDAATVQRDVVKAQVVGHNQNNIGPFASSRVHRARAGLPPHRLRGAVVLMNEILDRQQHQADPAADGVVAGSGDQQQGAESPGDALEHGLFSNIGPVGSSADPTVNGCALSPQHLPQRSGRVALQTASGLGLACRACWSGHRYPRAWSGATGSRYARPLRPSAASIFCTACMVCSTRSGVRLMLSMPSSTR